MSDVSKCSGQTLNTIYPMREQCYRYTALSNEYRQAWMPTPLQWVEGGQRMIPVCDYFGPNDK